MTPSELKKQLASAKRERDAEKTAKALCDYCASRGFALPVREHSFCMHRDWRFDYAWPDFRIALELEGGTFAGGRHSTGAGMRADMEKYNEAALRGWLVLRCETSKARSARVLGWIWRAMNARKEGADGKA